MCVHVLSALLYGMFRKHLEANKRSLSSLSSYAAAAAAEAVAVLLSLGFDLKGIAKKKEKKKRKWKNSFDVNKGKENCERHFVPFPSGNN